MASASPADQVVSAGLDTTVRIMTPERIAFDYPLAGPFRRAMAYFIDVLVMSGLVLLGLLIVGILSNASRAFFGVYLAGYFLLTWGYGIFWEGIFNGRTPGKKAIGLRVVTTDGLPITATQAVIRNTVGAADGVLPFFYMSGLTSMLLTDRFQRLGDLAAGTMVIVEKSVWRPGIERVDTEPEVNFVLPYVPLRIRAGTELARALSDYVKVRKRFGRARRQEMAEPLARPLRHRYGLPPTSSADAVLCAVYHRVFLGE